MGSQGSLYQSDSSSTYNEYYRSRQSSFKIIPFGQQDGLKMELFYDFILAELKMQGMW